MASPSCVWRSSVIAARCRAEQPLCHGHRTVTLVSIAFDTTRAATVPYWNSAFGGGREAGGCVNFPGEAPRAGAPRVPHARKRAAWKPKLQFGTPPGRPGERGGRVWSGGKAGGSRGGVR